MRASPCGRSVRSASGRDGSARDAARRWLLGGVAVAMLAGLSVGTAQAGGRGGGGVIKPVDQTGCSAHLRGDRSQAYWSNVAFQTGEFEAPVESVRRAAGTGRTSAGAVGFDGRDADGLWLTHATIGYDLDKGELLATRPPIASNGVGADVRPGYSGVAWSTRPIVGGVDDWNAYPCASDAARYGAYGAEDAVALVRVGPYVVPVDPWTPVAQDGPRETREVRERLERGRQEWLRERGFIGQVRTFVNDAVGAGRTDARVDRPVAKFAGVSRPGSTVKDEAVKDEATKGGAAKDEGKKDETKKDEAKKVGETSDAGAPAVIHMKAMAITRISMPHAAGLRNSGTRVIKAAGQGAPASHEEEAEEESAN